MHLITTKNILMQCLLCLIALLIFSSPTFAKEVSPADLAKLQKDISLLKSSLEQYKGQRAQFKKALKRSELAIGKIGRKISAIKGQIIRQQKLLESLKQRQQKLQQESNKQQTLIAQQIRIAYQLGRQKKIKVILNQEDPAKVNRAITYLDYFNKARISLMTEFAATITELNSLEPTIIEEKTRLEDSQGDLDKQYASLEQERSIREDAIAALNATITTKGAQLSDAEKERTRLEKLLKAVEEAVANLKLPADYKDFAERKGQMKWPVLGRISNSFGTPRTQGGMRWQGVTLKAKPGNNVRAIHHGRIVFADWFGSSGLLIIVDHGEDYMSLYAHNESLLRETGDWVRAGEPLATVGSSGGQMEPALYFEIRHNGKAINPKYWIK
ncbi:MAG: septal ring factor EnvC (AmiA/AmiB activator) [Flavobacteriales bacterium]|jgi:septal ring factor EnvC (AmiA/AmiB activator)